MGICVELFYCKSNNRLTGSERRPQIHDQSPTSKSAAINQTMKCLRFKENLYMIVTLRFRDFEKLSGIFF